MKIEIDVPPEAREPIRKRVWGIDRAAAIGDWDQRTATNLLCLVYDALEAAEPPTVDKRVDELRAGDVILDPDGTKQVIHGDTRCCASGAAYLYFASETDIGRVVGGIRPCDRSEVVRVVA